jgi:hypothetical protein
MAILELLAVFKNSKKLKTTTKMENFSGCLAAAEAHARGLEGERAAEQKVPGHTSVESVSCEEKKRAEKFHDNFSVPRVFPSGSLSSEKLAREKVRFCALNFFSSPLGQ